MRKSFIAKLLLIVFACGIMASAEAADPTSINRLMEASGLAVQVPALVESSRGLVLMALSEADIEPGMRQTVQARVSRVLEPSAFVEAVASELERDLTAEDVEALLAWFESDVGRRLTAAEERATNVAAALDLMFRIDTLMQDTERVAFMREFTDSINGADGSVRQATYATLLTMAALWDIDHPGTPFNLPAIRVYLRGFQESVRAEMEEQTVISFVYTYREIDRVDLQLYKEFLATPVAKKFSEVFWWALDRQYELAAVELAQTSSTPVAARTMTAEIGASWADAGVADLTTSDSGDDSAC